MLHFLCYVLYLIYLFAWVVGSLIFKNHTLVSLDGLTPYLVQLSYIIGPFWVPFWVNKDLVVIQDKQISDLFELTAAGSKASYNGKYKTIGLSLSNFVSTIHFWSDFIPWFTSAYLYWLMNFRSSPWLSNAGNVSKKSSLRLWSFGRRVTLKKSGANL